MDANKSSLNIDPEERERRPETARRGPSVSEQSSHVQVRASLPLCRVSPPCDLPAGNTLMRQTSTDSVCLRVFFVETRFRNFLVKSIGALNCAFRGHADPHQNFASL